MRLLALDVGSRRIGVAVSDATGTLATPVRAISSVRSTSDAVSRIVACKEALERGDTPFAAIVVGLPAHLDGRPHERAAGIRALANAVGARVGLPVIFEDERLSSREAESRLARRIRDWRKRKALVDSAAAAVVLQDYLDRRRSSAGVEAID